MTAALELEPIDPTTGRRGDWMECYPSHKQFWPLDPRPEDFDIRDIAHHLGMICRYNGACKYRYSVAEHCVLMSNRVPVEFALDALMHDFAEAYIGDFIRPVKRSMPAFKALEHQICMVGAPVFGLTYPWPAIVHEADTRILIDERTVLHGPLHHRKPWEMDGHTEPLGVKIHAWNQYTATEMFLDRYNELARVPL